MSAYNTYFPMNYQPTYYPQAYQPPVTPPVQTAQPQPTATATPQPSNGNGLIWVQGESGAKSYLVAPNTTVMLMDSESERFYIKSADASGMPLPLRVFSYTEYAQNEAVANFSAEDNKSHDYVTKAEFDDFRAKIEDAINSKKTSIKNSKKDGIENE